MKSFPNGLVRETVILTSLLCSGAIEKIYTLIRKQQTLFLVFVKGHNKKVRAVITAWIIIFHFFCTSGQMDYWVIIPLSCLEPTLIVWDFQCVFHWLNSAPTVRNQTKPVPEIPLHKLALASQYSKNQYTKTNQHKNPSTLFASFFVLCLRFATDIANISGASLPICSRTAKSAPQKSFARTAVSKNFP